MADNTSSDDLRLILEELRTMNKSFVHATKENTKAIRHTTPHTSVPKPTGDAAVIKRLIDEQNKLSLMTRSLSTGFKKANDVSVNATKKFTEFSEAANHASAGLGNLTKLMGIGGIFGVMAKAVDNTTKTYQDMTAVGQSFGGSMLEMQTAAADAALPLDQFAAIIKKNNVVMATLGVKPFFEMSKALRTSMTDIGQLGMTSSQLNDFMGEYMNTQRLYGHLEGLSSDKSVAAMKSLAVETQKASEMTGMSRDMIMKGTFKAMQDETIRAKMMMMSSSSSASFTAALGKSAAYMSALPGTAGETLSAMLAQSVGRGSALLSDASQTFIDAGLFGVTDMMDTMAKKVASGNVTDQDQANFNKKFVAEGMKNMSSLQFQAATGNAAAKSAIIMISEMKALANKSPEDLAATSKMTKFMLNLSTVIDNLSGKIRGAFFKGLDNFMSNFEKFTDSPAFTELTEKIGVMATRFGTFLGEALTPERLIAFGSAMASGVEGLAKFSLMVIWCIEKVAGAFGTLSDTVGTLGAALGVVAAYMLAKFALSQVGNLLTQQFTIGGNQAQLTGEALAKALAKYAAGGALRVLMTPGSQGGPDLPDHENNRSGERRLPHQLPPNQHGPNLPDNHHLNQPHNLPNNQHGPRMPLDHPSLPHNQHGPHLPIRQPIPIPPPHPIETRSQRWARNINTFQHNNAERSSRVWHGLRDGVRHPSRHMNNMYYSTRRGGTRLLNHARTGGNFVSRQASNIAGGTKTVGNALMNGAKGGALGLAAGVAMTALPDFTGKDAMSGILAAGGTGAMIGGMLLPGVGSVIGGVLGGLYGLVTNWDDAKAGASKLFDTVGDWLGGIGSFFTGMFSSITGYLSGDSFGWVDLIPGVGIIHGMVYAFNHFGDWVTSIGTVLTDFGNWISSFFNGPIMANIINFLNNPVSGIVTGLSSALGLSPSVSNAIVSSFGGTPSTITSPGTDHVQPSIVAPNSPNQATTPVIDTTNATAAASDIKTQNTQIQKENSEMRMQINKLMETIAQGTNNTTGGLRDLISEQRKGNQNLGTLAGNYI